MAERSDWPDVPALANAAVRLEPLSLEHADGVRAAVDGPRASFAFTPVPTPDAALAHVEGHLARAARGESVPFAQVDPRSGRLVGLTTYLTPRRWPDGRLLAVEIGSTWLAPHAQGTAVNVGAKLLLLEHAFESWGVARVDIKTDARNARARASISALGATFEGVLRAWQPSAVSGEAGVARDTAMYSIVAGEWPAVRERLEARLAAKLAAR